MKGFMAIGCGLQLFIFGAYLAVSTWATDAILSWLGKDIPWYADLVIGFFAGAVAVPVGIVGSILKACGVF